MFILNLPSFLGLFSILGSVAYFILMIVQIVNEGRKSIKSGNDVLNIIFQILEVLYCPLAIFISGVILLFDGWRLDPRLQFQVLLILSVVAFLGIKNVVKK